MTTPAILGGTPAFAQPLPFARPAAPALDDVVTRLQPSYERGILTTGPLVRELESAVADRLGIEHVVAVSSCTSGLMLVLKALAGPGTRAMMPSFTFAATATAATWAEAEPVFAECEVDSFQLDVNDASERLSSAVGVIVGVHMFGAPCHPLELEALGRTAGIPVIFDAAHAFGASHGGRAVGSFGTAEVFSLSPTKPLVAGEGGLVCTSSSELAEQVRYGRDYGNPGDYDVRSPGLNARMSEFHAAVALESLRHLDEHLARRRYLVERYRDGLAAIPGIRTQAVDDADRSTFKLFSVVVDEQTFGMGGDDLARALRAEGVEVRRYFSPPVHRQHAFRRLAPYDLPHTDQLSAGVVSLPLYRDLPDSAVDTIVDVLGTIQQHATEIAEAGRLVCVSS